MIALFCALSFVPLLTSAEPVARNALTAAFAEDTVPHVQGGAAAPDFKALQDNGYHIAMWLELGGHALPVALRRLNRGGESWALAQFEEGSRVVVLDVAGAAAFSAEVKQGSTRTATIAITF